MESQIGKLTRQTPNLKSKQKPKKDQMRAKEEVVIGLPMGHVLESTLESTKREVIVSSGKGPPTLHHVFLCIRPLDDINY